METSFNIEKLNYVLEQLNSKQGGLIIASILKEKYVSIPDTEIFLIEQKLKKDNFIELKQISSARKIAQINDTGIEYLLMGGYKVPSWNVKIKENTFQSEIKNKKHLTKEQLVISLEVIQKLKKKYWSQYFLSNPDKNAILVYMKEVLENIFGSESEYYKEFLLIEKEKEEHDIKNFTNKIGLKLSFLLNTKENTTSSDNTSLSHIHHEIRAVSEAPFNDGHYSSAIFKAFVKIETSVKEKSGLNYIGKELMLKTFQPTNPAIRIAKDDGEQTGIQFLFAGAIAGIRNKLAHNNVEYTREHAIELLGFASILLKWLDDPKEYERK